MKLVCWHCIDWLVLLARKSRRSWRLLNWSWWTDGIQIGFLILCWRILFPPTEVMTYDYSDRKLTIAFPIRRTSDPSRTAPASTSAHLPDPSSKHGRARQGHFSWVFQGLLFFFYFFKKILSIKIRHLRSVLIQDIYRIALLLYSDPHKWLFQY